MAGRAVALAPECAPPTAAEMAALRALAAKFDQPPGNVTLEEMAFVVNARGLLSGAGIPRYDGRHPYTLKTPGWRKMVGLGKETG